MSLSARHAAIVALVPPGIVPVVDVGAHHGLVAEAVGAIATERLPHRRARTGVRWVVADGLRPFREVGTAVIAGMGARRIAGILAAGPRPQVAVLHAQDDPGWLRVWLAQNGWRLDAEALAPEARGFAQVIRAVPGHEPATGLALHLGPRLLEGDAPHRQAWLTHQAAWARDVIAAVSDADPAVRERMAARLAFVEEHLRRGDHR